MNQFNFNIKNTFCISLLSNKNRCEKMQKRFKELNIDVTIFPASTPNDIKNNCAHYLNIFQKACAQSHFNIWKHILTNNLEYALILEDDACFDKKFFEKINTFTLDVNDKNWHAIFLNASESLKIQNKWVLCDEQYLCGGYILSQKGCQILIHMYYNCLHAADWMTTRLQKYNHCYSYFPWLIIQEGIETTIGSGVEEDHKKVVRLLEEIDYSLDNYNI